MAYLDAVIDSDLQPVFNGTPEQTQEWLAEVVEQGLASEEWRVCIGTSLALVTIEEYQRRRK